MSSSALDDDGKVPTLGDVRRLMDEVVERQAAELKEHRIVLEGLLLANKTLLSPRAAAPHHSHRSRGGDSSGRMEPMVTGPSVASDGGVGHHASITSMKALGGDIISPPSSADLPSDPVVHHGSNGSDVGHRSSGSNNGINSVGSLGQHTASLFHGVQVAKFSMAKAFGFDPRAHEESERRSAGRDSSDRPSVSEPHGFISGLTKMKASQEHHCLERIVRSYLFENIAGALICLNAIAIGIHAHRRALHPQSCEHIWGNVFLGFDIWFVCELTMRVGVYRKEFFVGRERRWNAFDSIVVFAGLMEEFISRILGSDCEIDLDKGIASMQSPLLSSITVIRILRVMRIIRIIKAVRSMSIFRELRVMVRSVAGCLVPLAWACVLICFIQWCFSVYFLHLASDSITKALVEEGPGVLEDESKPYKELRKYFGSMWSSLFVLFQSISGGIDWTVPTAALFNATQAYHAVLLYMFFISFTVFAVLNLITAIFVDNAARLAKRDHELVIQESLKEQETYKRDVLALFKEFDSDKSGTLSYEELKAHLNDSRVRAFLKSLELDRVGAQRMFRLLDLDGNNSVSADEFVTGCMCLRGDAKSMDVAALLCELHKISKNLSRKMINLDRRLNDIHSSLTFGDSFVSYEEQPISI